MHHVHHSSAGALKPVWGYKHSLCARLTHLCGLKARNYIMQETAIEEQKTSGTMKGFKNYSPVATNLSVFAEGYFEDFLGMVLYSGILSIFLIWKYNL